MPNLQRIYNTRTKTLSNSLPKQKKLDFRSGGTIAYLILVVRSIDSNFLKESESFNLINPHIDVFSPSAAVDLLVYSYLPAVFNCCRSLTRTSVSRSFLMICSGLYLLLAILSPLFSIPSLTLYSDRFQRGQVIWTRAENWCLLVFETEP